MVEYFQFFAAKVLKNIPSKPFKTLADFLKITIFIYAALCA